MIHTTPVLTDLRGVIGGLGYEISADMYPDWNKHTVDAEHPEEWNQTFEKFKILGSHGKDDGTTQVGIRITGPTDGITIRDGTIQQCRVGISGVHGKSTFRESVIDHVQIRKCGVGISLSQPMVDSHDGINNIFFQNCFVTYPSITAVSLRNFNPAEMMRRITFAGGLYHALTLGTPIQSPLFEIIGRCKYINFRDINITSGDQTPTFLIQGNGVDCPQEITISGTMHKGEIWVCESSFATLDISRLNRTADTVVKVIPDFVDGEST